MKIVLSAATAIALLAGVSACTDTSDVAGASGATTPPGSSGYYQHAPTPDFGGTRGSVGGGAGSAGGR